MAVTLYPKQKRILDFIKQYIDKYGYSPTLKEIAEATGVTSLATVHEHLATLVKKGAIKKFTGAIRGIEVLEQKMSSFLQGIELPILGFIAAGEPLLPFTDPNASITISPSMVSGKRRSFVLQVKGDSMIDDGILDGDHVIIEEQNEASDGDIVVALLENGLATLKRFFKETDRIRLEPANSSMNPIYATDVRIQGRCVGVIRRYN